MRHLTSPYISGVSDLSGVNNLCLLYTSFLPPSPLHKASAIPDILQSKHLPRQRPDLQDKQKED